MFISHAKSEASMEARFVQRDLNKILGKQCFLDSDDLRDLSKLTEYVVNSDALVLVQSKGVLARPYCLIELLTALKHNVPIVGLSLSARSSGRVVPRRGRLNPNPNPALPVPLTITLTRRCPPPIRVPRVGPNPDPIANPYPYPNPNQATATSAMSSRRRPSSSRTWTAASRRPTRARPPPSPPMAGPTSLRSCGYSNLTS